MKTAKLIIDKDYVISDIDENIFSSFVEPIGRCIYGGIYEPNHPLANDKGFRQDVLELTRALNLSLNRFPGGCFVTTYNWEDGVGPREDRPRRLEPAWQSIETNQFGINDFVDWSNLNNSDIAMTVNLNTRGVKDAMNLLEYCNFDEGTYYSDLRKKHGYEAPHNIKYWCLSNEMDGNHQIGFAPGKEYGRIARETAKGLKFLDDSIYTILSGSSSPNKPRDFDVDALEESYDYIDYISIHDYISNADGDLANFLARPLITNEFIKQEIAVCDYVKAKLNSSKKINISFDEFNVWHSVVDESKYLSKRGKTSDNSLSNNRHIKNRLSWKWTEAPPLFEDVYTVADVLVLGSMFLSILRHSDRIKIACVSELVNCISHIRTSNMGGAWVFPPYYAFLHFSRYGRGKSLQIVIDSPKYDSKEFTDVPFLDAAATIDSDETITIFAINRSLVDSLPIKAELRGFDKYCVKEHIIISGENATDTNTEEDPYRVTPNFVNNAQIDEGILIASLPNLSWNVIRLTKVK